MRELASKLLRKAAPHIERYAILFLRRAILPLIVVAADQIAKTVCGCSLFNNELVNEY